MSIPFVPSNLVLAPIADSQQKFPIRRIFCVGRNYASHALEMGKDPEREAPFFFTKWAEAFVPSGHRITYPDGTGNFHYETELVVALGRSGRNIEASKARDYIFGYAVGLDMTRRDLQLEARAKGRPWDTGKNFEQSMPLGAIHKVEDIGHLIEGRICLEVNGTVEQDSDISQLIWSVEEIIEHLSALYQLLPGDIIMTGTPEGVGPVIVGDRLTANIKGLSSLHTTIGPRK